MKRAKRTGGVSDVDVVFWAHCVRCGRLLIGIASTRVGSVRVRLEERPATGRCCPGTWLIWLSDWSGFISFSTMLTVVSIFTASIVEIIFSLLVLTSPDSRVSAVVAASNRSLPAPLLPPDDALPAFSHIQPRGEGDDDDERPSRTNPPPPRACASTSSSANQPAATEQQRHQGRGKSARTLSWPCLSKGGQSLVARSARHSRHMSITAARHLMVVVVANIHVDMVMVRGQVWPVVCLGRPGTSGRGCGLGEEEGGGQRDRSSPIARA